jgi:hypothetical protein
VTTRQLEFASRMSTLRRKPPAAASFGPRILKANRPADPDRGYRTAPSAARVGRGLALRARSSLTLDPRRVAANRLQVA